MKTSKFLRNPTRTPKKRAVKIRAAAKIGVQGSAGIPYGNWEGEDAKTSSCKKLMGQVGLREDLGTGWLTKREVVLHSSEK